MGMIVLGIDPGYAITGWGVIDAGVSPAAIAYGAIRTDAKLSAPARLERIFSELETIYTEYRPAWTVVEKLFFRNNTTTAPGVYEARGVVLLCAARAGNSFLELPPSTIKQSVTGSGRAGKPEVMRMVERILNLPEAIRLNDTADALACALAGSFHLRSPAFRAAGGEG